MKEGPMKILIVGDKEAERAVLRTAVTQLGHDWREAADGDEGWVQFLHWQPHVVLSDFVMPGRNGMELCQEVRKQPFQHYTYFMILSSLAQRDNIFAGLRAGADDFLSKPVDVDELRLRLISAERVSSLHLKLAKQKQELQILNQQLFSESRKDALTGLGNRLKFQDEIPSFLSDRKQGKPVSVAICDIDCFKQYNDIYGHFEGDKILQLVAQQLSSYQGTRLHSFRFGGEEFLLVLPRRSLDETQTHCEELRAQVEQLSVTHTGNKPYEKLTLTFGTAALEGATEGDLDKALRLADDALYQGKNGGRNRVARQAQGAPH